ncbi:hypothetical protein D7X33_18265, partial [Butyricicoccus sp. 1XD8-22]
PPSRPQATEGIPKGLAPLALSAQDARLARATPVPPAGDGRDSKGASPFGAVRVGRLPGEGAPRPARRRRKGFQRG